MTRRGSHGLAAAVAIALLLLSTAVGGCGSDAGPADGGTGGSAGGRSGGGGGSAGGRSGGTGGTFVPDGGLRDGFSLDGIDFDAIAADLGITSCPGGVTGGASCTSGTDQVCRPASGGNICVCQAAGTWMCF